MTQEYTRGKSYVVDRGQARPRSGQGLAAGLGVVMRHFLDAFTKRLDNPSETSGIFTVQYPEERMTLPEASRSFPILLFDDATGHELCTSCYQCERICPPQVIHMTQAKDPLTGKAVPAVTAFIIEYDACMSCGLCAEVCPFDAIKMDHDFELSTDDRTALTVEREQLLRPISYYAELAPSMWAEAKDGALKKLQGTSRRRTGTIGIAPSMVDTVIVAATPATDAMAETATPATDATDAPAPAADTPPPTDKAARLAAIRAKNAVKEDTPATDAPAPAADTPPLTDKAARLAAIRAKNAAKQPDDEGSAS